MKKKSLLLILLMALIAPWAVAQQALPYSYGFEDNDLSIDGWTTQNPSGLNASEFGINKNAKKTGNYGFRFSSYNDSGTSTQAVSSPPAVQLSVAMVPSPGVRVAAKPVGFIHDGGTFKEMSSMYNLYW